MSEPIWSTGGAAGVAALTEDLEWAVGVLGAAAADVASAQGELARRRAALELDPSVGHAGATATLAHAATVTAPALEADLDDAARRLAGVVATYVEAERTARRGVGIVTRLREGLEDVGSLGWFVARIELAADAAASGAATMQVGRFRVAQRLMPDASPSTTALLDRERAEQIASQPAVETVAAALTAALALVERLLGEPWTGALAAFPVAMAPAHSLEDVMRRLLVTEDEGDGAVRIERWTGTDGVTRRIVYIPGTQDWWVSDPNPSDVEADGELRFGGLPDAARVVAAALAADGAQPDEPVMLAGHSLGGTVAAALAGSPAFTRRFAVTAIVTAGSPTGVIWLPRSVNALHLEGTRDIVPGLDGIPNPATPTRTTVHHDVRDSGDANLEGEGRTIASAHHLNTYAQTARMVDEGVSPSTDAWLRAEAGYFDDAKEVTVMQYVPGNT